MNLERIALRIAILLGKPSDALIPEGMTIGEAIDEDIFEKELQKTIDISTKHWNATPIKINYIGIITGTPDGMVELEGGGISQPWKIKFNLDEPFGKWLTNPEGEWDVTWGLPAPDNTDAFEAALDINGYVPRS